MMSAPRASNLLKTNIPITNLTRMDMVVIEDYYKYDNNDWKRELDEN
jgi:hypothetical protein